METSRPVDLSLPLTIAYPATGKDQGYAVLHREACSHSLRNGLRPSKPFRNDVLWGADDFFMVAPCAAIRSRKG
jgi:hypothetical protein